MKWTDIITQARDRLQEESETFFSTDRLMDIARRVQMEVAVITECLETSETVAAASGTIEYDLPEDCLNVQAATCDDYPLAPVNYRRLHAKVYPSGQPACYYIFGNRLGLYPAPNGASTLKIWYSQRPPLGGFTLIHDGTSGATAATAAVADGTLSLVITGGSYAGTDSFDLSNTSYDAIAELVAAINTLAKGWTAARIAGCKATEPSSSLECASATSAFQKSVTMDLAVKLPEQFQTLLELGVIYRALWKDTEYEAGEIYRREYVERLEALRRLYVRRNSRGGSGRVIDAYRDAAFPGAGAGIRIFIP